MTKSLIILTLLLSLPFNGYTCGPDGNSGFLPENDLYIGVDTKSNSNITEKKFLEIIDEIEDIYAPEIRYRGASLKVNKLWENGTVNASAQQQGSTWIVNMYGGLARHETVTPDAFALVLCHELGHHLGGAPKKGGWFSTWASNEGQADYWGTMKCLRKYLDKFDNARFLRGKDIPKEVVKSCEESFSNTDDQNICKRAALAGQSLAHLFAALRNGSDVPKFTTPDPSRVSSTYHGHPASQCRLDTYYQAALCDRDAREAVSDSDPEKGVCTRNRHYEHGVRPLCWYRP